MRPAQMKENEKRPHRRQACGVIFLAVGFVAFALSALAQGLFGTITGSVTDSTGAVVANATVTITNAATNVTTTVKTNGVGEFTAPSLNPGTYRVVAEANGFKRAIANEVILQVDARQKVNLRLQPGGATESIVVTATSPLLQTEQSSISQNVTGQQISELPVLGGISNGSAGRSVYNLIELSGAVTQQTGEGGAALDNARMSGGRPRTDDYVVDGTSTEAPTFGGPTVTQSVDSVEEMNIVTNSFSAEFGKVSGGVITITTKSGSNALHGSVYEYFQNDALNSKNYFQPAGQAKDPFRFNEFGGTIGGHIVKDKLFFFTDYQGLIANQEFPLHNTPVPDNYVRLGDLYDAGVTTQLYDPATGLPYVNNQVPVSPIAKKLLNIFPVMNNGESGQPGIGWFNGTSSNQPTVHRANPRIDWNPESKDHLFGVVHAQHERYNSNNGLPYGSSYTTNPDVAVTAGWTRLLGDKMLNDFHFGFNHRWPIRTPNGYGQVDASDFGINGIPPCNLESSHGKCGEPTLDIGGLGRVGGGGGMLIEPAGQYQFLDSVTLMRSRHTVKIGAEIRRAIINNIQPTWPEGDFKFDSTMFPGSTGNTFANFLTGNLDQSSIQVQSQYLLARTWSDALFIQDDYRLTPKLTLNLGMRWQYDPSWHEKNHQLASFDPYTLTWTQMGLNGAPQGSIDTHWAEFAPRLGLAYNPFPGTVFRAGFGITYPGVTAHGKGGDGNPSPNVESTTQIVPGTSIANLPAVSVPNPTGQLTTAQGSGFYYTPRTQGTNYFEQWNVTIQQQLGANTAATLTYSGSHGVHLPVNFAYNLCQMPQTYLNLYGTNANNMDSPYCAAGNLNALGWDYAYPGFWGMSSSVYHALEAKVEKRYSSGMSLLSTFTWSKLIDDSSSDWSGYDALDVYGQDFYHRSAERSVSAGDIPLRWINSGIYELPVGRGHRHLSHGLLGQVIGGWRATGIYSLSSGDPIGVMDGGFHGGPARTVGYRPTLIGDPLPKGFQRSTLQWFNTQAFDWSGTWVWTPNLIQNNLLNGYPNPAYGMGNTPRFFSKVRAAGVDNVDFSLQKDTKLRFGDQTYLRLQIDSFNTLNHPEFGPPDSSADANFGLVLYTRNNGRVLQLGMNLSF